jgi:hypothetical protein
MFGRCSSLVVEAAGTHCVDLPPSPTGGCTYACTALRTLVIVKAQNAHLDHKTLSSYEALSLTMPWHPVVARLDCTIVIFYLGTAIQLQRSTMQHIKAAGHA